MMIIDGKKEAKLLREKIKKEILKIKKSKNKVPGLTVILIGNYTPSKIYVKNKEKNSKEVGMNSDVIKYSDDVSEKEILNKIKELNNDQNVSGILVQLPLPKQIDKEIASLQAPGSAYWDKNHPGHAAAVEEVQSLFEQKHGEEK